MCSYGASAFIDNLQMCAPSVFSMVPVKVIVTACMLVIIQSLYKVYIEACVYSQSTILMWRSFL